MQTLSCDAEQIDFPLVTLVVDRGDRVAQVWSDLESNGSRAFLRTYRQEVVPRLHALGARHTDDWAPLDDNGKPEPIDVSEYAF